MNGAAAHRAASGDRVIICAYAALNEEEVERHKPRLVLLDEHNHVRETRDYTPVQAA